MRILFLPKWLRHFNCYSSYRCLTRELNKTAKCLSNRVTNCNRNVVRLVAGVLILVILIKFLLLLLPQDPCDTTKVQRQMCHDYEQGLITGGLCFEICVYHSMSLPRCLSKDKNTLTFQWPKLIGKMSLPPQAGYFINSKGNTRPYQLKHLEGSLSNKEFHDMLTDYLESTLGSVDLTPVTEKVYEFADTNHDGKLNLGEANSIWQLIHNPEFFILLIFQGESVFPVINGTCGSLFAYEKLHIPKLFDKVSKGFLDNFFSNTYRWTFPKWDKRANIGVGLLEYVTSLEESANSQFYMCNIQPISFGYTDHFETRLTYFDGIISQHLLDNTMKEKQCRRDEDCILGLKCMTRCDPVTRRCSGQVIHPTLKFICQVLKDYILFDAPDDIKVTLDNLLTQCLKLRNDKSKALHNIHSHYAMQYNLILSELTALLWDQVKSKPVNWLDPPKVKKVQK